MTETEHRPQTVVVPVTSGDLAAAGLVAERAELALAELQAENEALRRKIAGYENAITWNTSCTSCAATLDSSIREHDRAEKAETELAGLRERVLRGAEARATTLTWPYEDGTMGELDVVPVSALPKLLGMPVEPCGEHGEAARPETCGQCDGGLIPIGRCNCGSPADASIGYMHEKLCGFEPCPNGCWERLHPATGSTS